MKRLLYILAGFLLFNVGAGIVFMQVERFLLKPYRIASSAMEPELRCAQPGPGCTGDHSDRIFALRSAPGWTPERGDVVVFRAPDRARVKCGSAGVFVRRLVGLPGETVSQRNGRLLIDGVPLRELYVERGQGSGNESWKVPPGGYFFLGDNRTQSCDSREWGTVPRSSFIGPVVAVYLPFDRIGLL